jgi:Zn-dependent peptidase ImmA (M78 family)
MSNIDTSLLSNSAIAEYAERVGAHHNIYAESGYANLDRLLEQIGGRVEVSPMMIAHEALTVHGEGNFEIHLPPMTSARRDRFTIAHELGHYYLHYLHLKQTEPKRFFRGSQNRAETQANFFAASLLMPSDLYKRVFSVYPQEWWKIADSFGVSSKAAEVRAQVLGLPAS